MHRLFLLSSLLLVSSSCSDPRCSEGERRVGSACHQLPELDGGDALDPFPSSPNGEHATPPSMDGGPVSATDARSVPLLDAGRNRIVSISAGWDSTCAFTQAGETWCWGESFPIEGTAHTRPAPVPELRHADRVSLWNSVACARYPGHQLQCWGENDDGVVGDGTREPRGQPTPVAELGPVAQVSPGAGYVCALQVAGGVKCWGSDGIHGIGTLGGGTTGGRRYQLIPRLVPGTEDAVELDGSTLHSCVRTSMGRVLCWGTNQSGEVGDGTRMPRGSPTEAGNLTDVTAIGVSDVRTCAVHSSRQVLCWEHDYTLDEAERTMPPPPPAFVGKLSDVTALAMRGGHACGLHSSGLVSCWGANYVGQLGDGTLETRAEAKPVVGLSGVVQITAGNSHTCALLESSEVRCWGNNLRGQLGDGTTNARLTPVSVVGLP
jgi:alpha-tubulin suppressor-like RCC1 family protein